MINGFGAIFGVLLSKFSELSVCLLVGVSKILLNVSASPSNSLTASFLTFS
jgi:hypothetical protein